MLLHCNIVLPMYHVKYRSGSSPYMDDAETALLVAACVRRTRPNILEIGTARGRTTTTIASVITPFGGKVTTVDILNNPVAGVDIPYGLFGTIKTIRVDPANPDYRPLQVCKYDVIFIDGDHSYDAVLKDYNLAVSLLADGGIILFHDVWWDEKPMPCDGPLRFLDEQGGVVLNLTHIGCLSDSYERFHNHVHTGYKNEM